MQQIASYYRNKMSLPIIGVTGSVGKTTTREMIAIMGEVRELTEKFDEQWSQKSV